MNGACNVKLFDCPLGPFGRVQKVKYHLISITKSISKICVPNFVCVLTKMKDTKYIRWDFHSLAWVMLQGWEFGAIGAPRGS